MPTELTESADMAANAGNIDNKTGRDLIKTALAKIAGKQHRISVYNDYYFGKHPFNFASEKFTTQFAERLRSFRDNLCPTCVKAPADRLEVIGFSSDKAGEVYKRTWQTWLYSDMPRIAKRVHKDAFRTGDAFAIVWPDEAGNARIYHQDVRNCAVFYNSETNKVESGAKVWRGNDNYIYLTLYFADRLEKYVTRNPVAAGNVPTTAAAFVKRQVPGEAWPLENPFDMPALFHFGLETSILDDVIPLNDALNKSLSDMLVSSEANSLRQRWTSGIAYEVNPETGKQIIPFEHATQWFATNDPAGKFGQFPDGDLKGFLDVATDFRNEIANVAGIPQYYFRLEGGSLPSGEALRKAESRFTALVKDAQLDFGATWARIMEMAAKIDGIQTPAGSNFETQWTPADPMSTNELVDLAIKKKNVGISTERALSEIGYTDEDISTMKTENDTAAETASEQFSKTFNAGPQLG